jgi:hypothetical protein
LFSNLFIKCPPQKVTLWIANNTIFRFKFRPDPQLYPDAVAKGLRKSIRLRVITVLEKWLSISCLDFESNYDLRLVLTTFIESLLSRTRTEKWGKLLKSTYDKGLLEWVSSDSKKLVCFLSDTTRGLKLEEDLSFARSVFKGIFHTLFF